MNQYHWGWRQCYHTQFTVSFYFRWQLWLLKTRVEVLHFIGDNIDFIGFYAHVLEKVSKFTCILWMDVNKLLLYIYVNSLF
jgi:hypothetical protein